MEISSLSSGWIFDGAPSSGDRAGELTNRLDDPTLPDPDEDPTSSLLILHLTDKPVYYASQTGDYLYTSYDFVVSNPMISNEEFWGEIVPYFEMEEVPKEKIYPDVEYEEVTNNKDEKVRQYRNRIVYQVERVEDGRTVYWKVNALPGKDLIIEDANGANWIPNYQYYVLNDTEKYNYYCIKIDNGLYRSANKIYYNNGEKFQRILHYNGSNSEIDTSSYYVYKDGIF
jgi:hypothetical protein